MMPGSTEICTYLVIGLSAVRWTLRSIFLSHISLIVQPAPLIIKAPVAKSPSNVGSGKGVPGGVANPKLQPHGQNNNQEPMGLSIRISFKKGCRSLGAFSTKTAIELFLNGTADAENFCCLQDHGNTVQPMGIPPNIECFRFFVTFILFLRSW